MKFSDRIYWLLCGRDYRKLYKLVSEGFAQLKSEDYDRARSTFLEVLEFRDKIAGSELLDWVLGSLETTWLFRDEYDGQIEFFSDYIRRYPKDAGAYVARAGGFWYSGRLPEAVGDYNRALELKPDLVSALSGRAQLLTEMGKHEQAMEELDRALVILRKDSRANPRMAEYNKHIEAFMHRARGVALAALGKTDAAMDEFNVSISLSPENAWVYYSRAGVQERTGNGKSALADYRLALQQKSPPLNANQRKQAKTRIGELDSAAV